MHLAHLFQRLAQVRTEDVALVDQDAVRWPAAAFVDRVHSVAGGLLGLGLRRGDRVALLQGDTRQYLESDYGTMVAGLVRVPLDPRLAPAEVLSQLADSGARVLIADAGPLDRLRGQGGPLPVRTVVSVGQAGPGAVEYESLLAPAGSAAPDPGAPDDLASLNYTGGTTSRPKAVRLTHRNLSSAVGNILVARPVLPGDVFLNVRPLWPISAIVVLVHVLAGATVVLGGRFDAGSFPDLCERWGATATSLVPTQLVRLVDRLGQGAPRGALPTLRVIDVGGSAIPADVFRAAIALLGPRIAVIYGLTEAPWSCYLPAGEPAGAEHLVRSAGRELFGCEVAVRDERGRALPPGETGEVTIRGDHVTAGYWNRADETARALRDGWLYTGDLGRLAGDGHLYVAGRKKEIIRSGGKAIVPSEVEEAVLSHPSVAEAAAVGISDREWGEVVKVFVVLRAGMQASGDEIVDHCRSRLSPFKKPRFVEFVPALPRSHYGKVLRDRLKAPAQGGALDGSSVEEGS